MAFVDNMAQQHIRKEHAQTQLTKIACRFATMVSDILSSNRLCRPGFLTLTIVESPIRQLH